MQVLIIRQFYRVVEFVFQCSGLRKNRSPTHGAVGEYASMVGAVVHVEPVFKALGHKFPLASKVMDRKSAFVKQGRDQYLVMPTPFAEECFVD